MPWLLLLLSGALEALFPTLILLSDGMRNPRWLLALALCGGASIWLLKMAMQHIPFGIAYAFWTGIGVAGTAAIGVAFLGEDLSWSKLLFLCVLIVAVAGLQQSTAQLDGQESSPRY